MIWWDLCISVWVHPVGVKGGRRETWWGAIVIIHVRVLCGLGQCGSDRGGSKVIRVWIYLEDRAHGIYWFQGFWPEQVKEWRGC